MNTFQIVVLGLAAILGGSVFWDQISAFLGGLTKPKPTPGPEMLGKEDAESLSSLIVLWENLRDELGKRGLNKAKNEVQKVFPLFVEEKASPSTPVTPPSE